MRQRNCNNCEITYNYEKKSSKFCSTKCRNESAWKRQILHRRESLENTVKMVMQGCRARAKRKGLLCDVTDNYILELLKKQNNKCAVTGIQLEPSKHLTRRAKSPYTASIDRIDNSKGYIIDNIQIVCVIVNEFKNVYSMTDVIRVSEAIYNKYHE